MHLAHDDGMTTTTKLKEIRDKRLTIGNSVVDRKLENQQCDQVAHYYDEHWDGRPGVRKSCSFNYIWTMFKRARAIKIKLFIQTCSAAAVVISRFRNNQNVVLDLLTKYRHPLLLSDSFLTHLSLSLLKYIPVKHFHREDNKSTSSPANYIVGT